MGPGQNVEASGLRGIPKPMVDAVDVRKYVMMGVFAVAAILTPPDPISQIGLGIPILLLYELSIIAVSFIEKRKNS